MARRYPVTWLVEIAKVSRAGYYKWKTGQEQRAARQQDDQILQEQMLAIHKIARNAAFLEELHQLFTRIYLTESLKQINRIRYM